MKTLLSDPSATFYTTGAGLRGVPVLVMDRDDGTLISARVYSNTATQIRLDIPLSRSPDQYDAYVLGSVPTSIESGDLTFGAPQERKSISTAIFDYERRGKGKLAFYLAADPTSPTRTTWQFVGYVPLTGNGRYLLPTNVPAATGYTIRYCVMGTDPAALFALTHLAFEFTAERNFA